MADIMPPETPSATPPSRATPPSPFSSDLFDPRNRYGCPVYSDGTIKRRSIRAGVRRAVAEREGCAPGQTADASCTYCGAPGQIVWHQLADGRPSAWVSLVDLHFDHIHPYSKGGQSVAENLALACKHCNSSKCDRFIDEWVGRTDAS